MSTTSSNSTVPASTGSRTAMLTTIDNPYDPFTQWDEWLKYDRDQGYYTNEYLASLVTDDETLSSDQSIQAIEEAMRYIVENNPTGIWTIRYKEDKK